MKIREREDEMGVSEPESEEKSGGTWTFLWICHLPNAVM